MSRKSFVHINPWGGETFELLNITVVNDREIRASALLLEGIGIHVINVRLGCQTGQRFKTNVSLIMSIQDPNAHNWP